MDLRETCEESERENWFDNNIEWNVGLGKKI